MKVILKHPQTLEVWFSGTHSDMYIYLSTWGFEFVMSLHLEEAGMWRMPRWIRVDLLWGGWCFKQGLLVFTQNHLSMSSLIASRSMSSNLWHGSGGCLSFFSSMDWHTWGELMEKQLAGIGLVWCCLQRSSPCMILLCGRFCTKLQLGVNSLSTSEFPVAHIWPPLADGWQAVYNQVIDKLKKLALKPEIMFQLLDITIDILGGVHQVNLKLSLSIEIHPLIADLWRSNEKHYQETVQQFMEQLMDHKWKPHSSFVNNWTHCSYPSFHLHIEWMHT